MASNVFRGALGHALPHQVFAPVRSQGGPSGLANLPRPFVLRSRHLDSRSFETGERFELVIHLFGSHTAEFVDAFEQSPPFHGAVRLAADPREEHLAVSLTCAAASDPGTLKVRFLTPTELKEETGLSRSPTFPVLFSRAITRIASLASFYSTPLTLDFKTLIAQANSVEMTGCELVHHDPVRVSSRTGQEHSLGGFTGEARYEGNFSELRPFLEAARFTGVGRQTVWGKGEIEIV